MAFELRPGVQSGQETLWFAEREQLMLNREWSASFLTGAVLVKIADTTPHPPQLMGPPPSYLSGPRFLFPYELLPIDVSELLVWRGP